MTESKQHEEAVTNETEQKRNYVKDGAFVLVMAAFAYWWF